MKCLIIDVVSPAIAEELGKFMEVDTKILPTQAELAAMIGDYEVLIMRVDPAINKEILDAAKKLKVIGVCSVGLNHIDMAAAKEKGIQVFNAPGLNDNAVAELTIAKMLEISRHTIPACIDVKVNKTEGTGSVTDANGDVIATTPSTPSYPIGGGSTGGNKPSTPDDSTSGSTGTPDEDNRGDVEDSAGTPSTPTVPGSGEIADENITGGNANDCKDGHTWGEAQTTTAATCTVDGIGTYTCSVCGAKGTVTITKTGHSLTKITVTKQPTCSAVGKKTVACANPGCTQSSVEDIAMLEHDFTADNRKGYDENGHYNLCKYCDAKGTSSAHTLTYDTKTAEKHTGKCVCGYTKSDAHTFGEAQTSKEPNCTEKGSKTSTCSICKYEKVEEIAIDSTKHDWSNKDGVCKNNSAHKCDHGSTAPGATCGTCGATLPAATPDPEPVEHTHDYQYQASQDGSKCVGTCASQVGTCTEKTVEKTHTANQKCDFCGTTYTPDTTEGDGQGDTP